MAFHAPSTSLNAGKPSAVLSPTSGNDVALRRPSDRFALRSSFLPSLSIGLSVLPNKKSVTCTAPRFFMRVASKQSYICRDCGYIYSDRTPFDKLPDKWFCPVCGAPKRRFRAYQQDVSKNVNDTTVRKARKAEIQRDETIGKALPIAVVVGVVALAGLYFYLNGNF